MNIDAIVSLSDDQLCGALKEFARDERDATARLVAALGEMDRRRLFLAQGCPSLFAYCTQVLHLAEAAAYSRIEVARLANRWPLILDRLAAGSINLTAARLLATHLTDDNHRVLLDAAAYKSKRDVQEQMAARRPQPDVPSSIRKLPNQIAPAARSRRSPSESTTTTGPMTTSVEPTRAMKSRKATPGESDAPEWMPMPVPTCPERAERVVGVSAPARPAVVAPLAPERFKVQFTMSRESYDRLRQAQDLLRHVIPGGDPAAIFERALRLMVSDLERKKLAQVDRPRVAAPVITESRRIPAAVTREVWKKDGGRCAFVGPEGRCTERGFLEFHHVVPFADGGPTTSSNLSLRCRAHNQHEAEGLFGPLLARETDPFDNSPRNQQGCHGALPSWSGLSLASRSSNAVACDQAGRREGWL